MNRIIFLVLTICGAFPSATYAQDHLVSHRFIRNKVTEGYFMQKAGTTIPLDDFCINATEAKTWLYLIENRLPAETNRMPWWSELVPVPKVIPCTGISDSGCQADYEAYGACGSWLYDAGFDVNFATFNRQRIGGTTNPLWNPSAALAAQYCATLPPALQSVPPAMNTAIIRPDSSISETVINSAPDSAALVQSVIGTDSIAWNGTDSAFKVQVFSATASVWSGALNRCGVWACNNLVGNFVWMSASGEFAAPVTKTYYIGLAADDLFELYIDGILVAAMNNAAAAPEVSFLMWHILPVPLTAGLHTIEIRGRNTKPGPASLGCEVYDNTPAELNNAATIDDLHILFTTKDYRGKSLCRSQPVTSTQINQND